MAWDSVIRKVIIISRVCLIYVNIRAVNARKSIRTAHILHRCQAYISISIYLYFTLSRSTHTPTNTLDVSIVYIVYVCSIDISSIYFVVVVVDIRKHRSFKSRKGLQSKTRTHTQTHTYSHSHSHLHTCIPTNTRCGSWRNQTVRTSTINRKKKKNYFEKFGCSFFYSFSVFSLNQTGNWKTRK